MIKKHLGAHCLRSVEECWCQIYISYVYGTIWRILEVHVSYIIVIMHYFLRELSYK